MGAEFPPQPQPHPQPQPPASPPPPPYSPYGPPPPSSRRLVRSSRERMWAGVAGGMAEYFDLDPSLVRLMWVAAAVGRDPATDKGVPSSSPAAPTEEEWWRSDRYVERHRHHGRHPRSTGIVLVTLGVLLLAANAGIFSWIEWRTMWPMIFIGLGVLLLARQTGWGR